jgi:peptide-methionine (R)-S-oxide reductase
MSDMRNKPESYWREKLTPEQYRVLREKGTEYPGTGTLLYNDALGEYRCAACNNLIFTSDAKYESTTPGLIGWPSFSEAASRDAVELQNDDSHWMSRTEVICKKCGSHLGHVFDDESSPTQKHYCINSCALEFKKK